MKKPLHISTWKSSVGLLILLLLLANGNLLAAVPAYNTNTIDPPNLTLAEQQAVIDHFNETAFAFRRQFPDSLFHYAQLALEASEAIGYEYGLTFAHKNIGIYRFKKDFPADSIVVSYERSLFYAQKQEDYYSQAALHNNIALVKHLQGRFRESIKLQLQGLIYIGKHTDEPNFLAGLLHANLATNYRETGEMEKAKDYLERAFTLGEKIDDPLLKNIYSDDYGGVLIDIGKVEEGLQLLQAHISDDIVQKDVQSAMQCYLELARYHNRIGSDYDLAEQYAESADELATQYNFTSFKAQIYLVLAKSKYGQQAYQQAIQYAEQSLGAARHMNKDAYEQQVYTLLSKIYSAKENFELAFAYLSSATRLQEDIEKAQHHIIIQELEAEYQLKEQARHIVTLKEREQQQKRFINLLVSLCVLGIIVLFGGVWSLWVYHRNQQLVEEKNAELKKYIEHNLELENFAHVASHDLKTPLRNINSFAQLVEQNLERRSPEELREYLSYITKGSQDMGILLEDMMTYSLLNKADLSIEAIHFKSMVNNLLSTIHTTISEKKVNVLVRTDTEIIVADSVKLKQLLQNLILNGIKFSQPDTPPVIKITLESEDHHWMISVSDNGIGIKEEFQEQIFLIFQRLHTKLDYEGTGVGLAICKRVAEHHGGQISVISREGEGSTFVLKLPKRKLPVHSTTSKSVPFLPGGTIPKWR